MGEERMSDKFNTDFSPNHSFLEYCKNCLLDMIKYADEKHLSNESFSIPVENEEVLKEYCNLNNTDRQKWLLENGHEDAVYNFYYKHLFFSLVVDFSNYYIASIEQAFNGNINVAWALLRKPLQETLAYLEWLYVDKVELVKLMLESEKVEEYEIVKKRFEEKRASNIHKIQSDDVSAIIDMYDFRYSYTEEFSLNGILQATNHLITTRPNLKTSPSGLNFVFMNDEIYQRNVGFYYTSIPYVMFYTMDVITKIFIDIAKLGEYTVSINKYNLALKNLYAAHTSFDKVKTLLNSDEMYLFCSRCGKKHNSDLDWIKFTQNRFRCRRCFKKLNTNTMIFDFEDVRRDREAESTKE